MFDLHCIFYLNRFPDPESKQKRKRKNSDGANQSKVQKSENAESLLYSEAVNGDTEDMDFKEEEHGDHSIESPEQKAKKTKKRKKNLKRISKCNTKGWIGNKYLQYSTGPVPRYWNV